MKRRLTKAVNYVAKQKAHGEVIFKRMLTKARAMEKNEKVKKLAFGSKSSKNITSP